LSLELNSLQIFDNEYFNNNLKQRVMGISRLRLR